MGRPHLENRRKLRKLVWSGRLASRGGEWPRLGLSTGIAWILNSRHGFKNE